MRRTGFLVILLALAAGVAVGYVLGSGSGNRDGALEAPPAPPPAAADRASSGRTLPAPRVEEGELDAWTGSSEAPAVRAAVETIRCRVQTPEGAPVEGVRVRATPAWSKGHPDPDAPLRARVAAYVLQQRFLDTYTRKAITGTDGEVEIRDLVDAAYRIEATKDGFQISSQAAWQVRPGQEVTFRAEASAVLRLRVLLPDGGEPEIAQLRCERVGRKETQNGTWKPTQRQMQLKPGEWKVRATAGEAGGLRSEEVSVKLEAGEPSAEVTLALAHHPGIRGRVTRDGKPVREHVEIVCVRVRGGGEPTDEQLLMSRLRTGAFGGGTYSFADLEPGRYRVAALRGSRVLVSAEVTVADRVVVRDLEIPPPNPEDSVTLRIEGPDGELLEASRIEAGYRSSRGNHSGGSRQQRQEDGSYRVRDPVLDPGLVQPDGRHYLQITVAGMGTRQVEYVASETRTLTVRFEVPGSLTVTVTGFEGSGYEDALDLGLAVLAPDGDSGRSLSLPGDGAIGPDGTKTFEAVVPGDYEICLRLRSGDYSVWTVSRTPVTVVSGENSKTVSLPRLYTLTVLTEGLPGAARLGIRSVGDGPQLDSGGPRSATDGKVVFRGLPAGKYVVRTFGRGDAQMTVTLPGPSVVKFEAEDVNALSVRITDPDGFLARAGFRSGDVIIGIEGEEFENMRQMYAHMLLAAEKGPVKLLVLRGTAREEISLDLSGFLTGEVDPGARLEPSSR